MNDKLPSTPTPSPQSREEKIMARARARVELEDICDDAAELLGFENTKQFGIRHALIFTTVSAVAMAVFRETRVVGPAFAAMFGCGIVWFVVYALLRERKKENEIEQRMRDFKRRHRGVDYEEGMDANMLWKTRNRRR